MGNKHFKRERAPTAHVGRFCGRCRKGWVGQPVTEIGWRRFPSHDRDGMHCYVTASGILSWFTASGAPPTSERLCNCVRRVMGLPEIIRVREDGTNEYAPLTASRAA